MNTDETRMKTQEMREGAAFSDCLRLLSLSSSVFHPCPSVANSLLPRSRVGLPGSALSASPDGRQGTRRPGVVDGPSAWMPAASLQFGHVQDRLRGLVLGDSADPDVIAPGLRVVDLDERVEVAAGVVVGD